MPTYEYRCNDTGNLFELRYRTYAEYEAATPRSPFTGSTNVTQLIRRVNIGKSMIHRAEYGVDDHRMFNDLENADPQTIGRTLRQISNGIDEPMDNDFHEVIERLESGQSPEQVEAAMMPKLMETPHEISSNGNDTLFSE